MTLMIAKTPAETDLAEKFETLAAGFPGGAETHQQRKAAFNAFAQAGLPHRRIESWKYTDLRSALKSVGSLNSVGEADAAAVDQALGPFADLEDAVRFVLVDGSFAPTLSAQALPAGLKVASLGQQLGHGDTTTSARNGAGLSWPEAAGSLAALNAALAVDGAVIEVEAGAEIAPVVVVVHLRTRGEQRFTSTRSQISVGAGARLTLVELFVSQDGASDQGGVTNTALSVDIGDGAHVTHAKVTREDGITHLADWRVALGRETVYRPFLYTAGPALVRNTLHIDFNGEDAKLDASGCFLGRHSEHIDNTLVIDHKLPGCESRELFKGVLDDRARGIFQGKVIVQPIAQKTDGKQMAQALMLSPHVEFDSKPELEIYADDVACGHGSTCAELDPDHIFYLRARGVSLDTAKALLMEAFVNEAIEQVDDARVADRLVEIAQAWLNQRTA